MLSRIFALLIWAAVAISTTHWTLRWLARPQPVPAHALAVSGNPAPRADFTRVLAGPARQEAAEVVPTEAAQLASRLKLIGVVAPRIALISVDGKPPRPFKPGQVVDGNLVVQSLTVRGVSIGISGGPEAVSLALPGLPPPATGVPGGMGLPGGVAMATPSQPFSADQINPGVGYVPAPSLPTVADPETANPSASNSAMERAANRRRMLGIQRNAPVAAPAIQTGDAETN